MQFRRPQFVVFATLATAITGNLAGAIAIPLMGKEMNVSPAMLGGYGGAWALPYIFAAWSAGRLSDRLGRRTVLNASVVLHVASLALLMFSMEPILLYLPSALIGTAQGMFWPTIEATNCDGQTPAQTKRATGIFNCLAMTGLTLGAPLGGILYPLGYRVPAIAAMGLMIVLLVVINLPGVMDIVPWGADRVLKHAHASPAKRELFVTLAFLGNVTAFLMIGSYRALIAQYTTEQHFLGWRYGALQGACALGMAVTSLGLIRWHGWHYSLRFLLAMEVLAVLLLVAFCATDNYAALLGLTLALGLPAGVTYYSSIFYGMEQTQKKGSHSGNHEAVIGVGSASGPLIGGLAITLMGNSRANLWLCAILFVLVIGIQMAMARARLKSLLI